MSEPKRHHHLPMCYLGGFCNDGQLWVFDRLKKTYRAQTPINTAVRKHYYTVEHNDGQKDTAIEKMLGAIEGYAKRIIDKIRLHKNISLQEKMDLSVFIALMLTRGPEFEEMVNNLSIGPIKKIADSLAGNENFIVQTIKKVEEDTGEPFPSTVAEMKDAWNTGKFQLEIRRNLSLQLMLETSPEISRLFSMLEWTFVIPPKGCMFITSDSPFVTLPPTDPKVKAAFNGGGLLIPTVRKIFPISGDICLVIRDKGLKTEFFNADNKYCEFLNLALALGANRFCIGSEIKLLKKCVQKSKAYDIKKPKAYEIQEVGPYQITYRKGIEIKGK